MGSGQWVEGSDRQNARATSVAQTFVSVRGFTGGVPKLRWLGYLAHIAHGRDARATSVAQTFVSVHFTQARMPVLHFADGQDAQAAIKK